MIIKFGGKNQKLSNKKDLYFTKEYYKNHGWYLIVLTQIYRTHTDPLFYNFRILNNKIPESVSETFVLMLHSHNTRSNNQIVLGTHNFFGNIFYKIPMY